MRSVHSKLSHEGTPSVSFIPPVSMTTYIANRIATRTLSIKVAKAMMELFNTASISMRSNRSGDTDACASIAATLDQLTNYYCAESRKIDAAMMSIASGHSRTISSIDIFARLLENEILPDNLVFKCDGEPLIWYSLNDFMNIFHRATALPRYFHLSLVELAKIKDVCGVDITAEFQSIIATTLLNRLPAPRVSVDFQTQQTHLLEVFDQFFKNCNGRNTSKTHDLGSVYHDSIELHLMNTTEAFLDKTLATSLHDNTLPYGLTYTLSGSAQQHESQYHNYLRATSFPVFLGNITHEELAAHRRLHHRMLSCLAWVQVAKNLRVGEEHRVISKDLIEMIIRMLLADVLPPERIMGCMRSIIHQYRLFAEKKHINSHHFEAHVMFEDDITYLEIIRYLTGGGHHAIACQISKENPHVNYCTFDETNEGAASKPHSIRCKHDFVRLENVTYDKFTAISQRVVTQGSLFYRNATYGAKVFTEAEDIKLCEEVFVESKAGIVTY